MNVLLVDDDPMICVYLSEILGRALAGAVVHIEKDLAGALEFARRSNDLGMVVLDLRLSGCGGIDALTRFRAKVPHVPIVVMSASDDRASIVGALNAGAVGYILKSSTPEMIIAALELVAAGGTYVPREALSGVPGGSTGSLRRSERSLGADLGLTARQIDVLRLLLKALPNRQIAKRLDIADSTVKQHVSAIYKSLGVASRAETLIAAVRRGIKLD